VAVEIRPRPLRIRIPATTSNLGPGFDVLGMALALYNDIEVSVLPGKGPDQVEIAGEGADRLPRDGRNLVLRAFREALGWKFHHPLRWRMKNRIPLCRGLGSSGAARLGGALAAAALSRTGKDRWPDFVAAACRMEGHPDNVMPAFFGGLCGSYRVDRELRFFRLRRPVGLRAVVCIPELEVPTEKARRVLPKTVPLADAVRTAARLAVLVTAFEQRRYERLAAGMDDVLHQPYRKRLIPGLYEALSAARRAGAHGAALSGSGSAVFALSPTAAAARAGAAMARAFARRGLRSRSLVLDFDYRGAEVR